MSPTLAILLAITGVALLLFGIYLSIQSSRAKRTFDEAKAGLDRDRVELEELAAGRHTRSSSKAQKKSKGSPQSSGPSQSEFDDLKRQFEKARDKLGKQREKTQHLSRERDELKQKISNLKSAQHNSPRDANALVDMRMELAEAMQQAAHYKQRVDALEQGRGEASRDDDRQERETKERVTPEESSVDKGDDEAYIQRLKRQLDDLAKQMRGQEGEYKKQLKKQGRDVERQMRRADNNDKAYRITQRELDVSRERVIMLQDQLERARFGQAAAQAVLAPDESTHDENAAAPPAPQAGRAEEPSVDAEAELVQEAVEALAEHQPGLLEEDTAPLRDNAAEPSELDEQEPQSEPTVEAASSSGLPARGEEEEEEEEVTVTPADKEVERDEASVDAQLADTSGVDEAWGDFDLDEDDDESF